MEFDIFLTLLEQSPGLVGAIVIVLAFIKYIQKRDSFMKTLTDSCNKVQHESNQVMRETKEQLGRNAEVLSEVFHTIKFINQQNGHNNGSRNH